MLCSWYSSPSFYLEGVGAKLCILGTVLKEGTITGVDISTSRLSTCRSLLKKFRIERARLFNQDGTEFDVYAPSQFKGIPLQSMTCFNTSSHVDVQLKIPVFYATRALRFDPQLKSPRLLYDKVLVDAECTLFFLRMD